MHGRADAVRRVSPDRRGGVRLRRRFGSAGDREQYREHGGRVLVVTGCFGTHRGMFPCFFGGRVWRFSASIRSAPVIIDRVADGLIT